MADPAANFPTSQDAFATLDGTNDILSDNPNARANAIEAIEGFIGFSGVAQPHNATMFSLLKDNYVGGRVYKKDDDEIYIGAFAGIITNVGDTIRKVRVVTSITTLSASALDTGAFAANTAYYIYATADASSTEPTFVMSANASTPSGYTYYRRIGWFYNESGGTAAIDIANGFISSFTGGGNINKVFFKDGEVNTGTTVMPNDDTIPQNTEGDQFMEMFFVPTSTMHWLAIDVIASLAHTGNTILTGALFQDALADAIAGGQRSVSTSNTITPVVLSFSMIAGTTGVIAFRFRAGGTNGATTTFNGASGARKLGGVMFSSIQGEEY